MIKLNKFIFNETRNNFITRHKNVHDVISLILTLVIIPIYSCITTHTAEWAGGTRAVFNSLSSLAYVEGQLIWVIIWGILNVGTFVYLIILNTFDSGLNKYIKWLLIVCAFIGLALLSTSASIPYTYGTTEKDLLNNKYHNFFAHWGFGVIVVVFCLYALILAFRSLKQFKFTGLVFVFVMTIVLYILFEANEKDISRSDISAISQVVTFLTFNAYLTFCYFTNRLFKIDK